jgi:hypothetical protein
MRPWVRLRRLAVIGPVALPAAVCGGVRPNEGARSGEAEKARGFRSRDARRAQAASFADGNLAEAVRPWPANWRSAMVVMMPTRERTGGLC